MESKNSKIQIDYALNGSIVSMIGNALKNKALTY
jgi:hypothetical protein